MNGEFDTTSLKCGKCGTVNRIRGRQAAYSTPICGLCGATLGAETPPAYDLPMQDQAGGTREFGFQRVAIWGGVGLVSFLLVVCLIAAARHKSRTAVVGPLSRQNVPAAPASTPKPVASKPIAAAPTAVRTSGAEQVYVTAKPAVCLIVSETNLELHLPDANLNPQAIRRSTAELLEAAQASPTPENIHKAVIRILANDPQRHVSVSHERRVISHKVGPNQGTGFFVTPEGHIVTNAHVVGFDLEHMAEGALKSTYKEDLLQSIEGLAQALPPLDHLGEDAGRELAVSVIRALIAVRIKNGRVGGTRFVIVRPAGTARSLPARVLKTGASYPKKDVAVLKVDGGAFPHITMGEESSAPVGGAIFAVGFPGAAFSGGMSASSLAEPSITSGIISAKKNSSEGWPLIQIDAAISGGNSGGPALDQHGHVIGIATASGKSSLTGGPAEGIHFVIPTSVIKEFLSAADVKIRIES